MHRQDVALDDPDQNHRDVVHHHRHQIADDKDHRRHPLHHFRHQIFRHLVQVVNHHQVVDLVVVVAQQIQVVVRQVVHLSLVRDQVAVHQVVDQVVVDVAHRQKENQKDYFQDEVRQV